MSAGEILCNAASPACFTTCRYDAHVMAYDTDQDLHQIEIRDGDGSPVVINWYDLNEPHRGVRVNGM